MAAPYYDAYQAALYAAASNPDPEGGQDDGSAENEDWDESDGQKSKNWPKSYFLVMECLETWSESSLQQFGELKAVKPKKKVW